MRSNIPLITPCHLYLNLKFSEFSEVQLPSTLYMSHMLIDNHVRELYVTHVQKIELLFGIQAAKVKFFTPWYFHMYMFTCFESTSNVNLQIEMFMN